MLHSCKQFPVFKPRTNIVTFPHARRVRQQGAGLGIGNDRVAALERSQGAERIQAAYRELQPMLKIAYRNRNRAPELSGSSLVAGLKAFDAYRR